VCASFSAAKDAKNIRDHGISLVRAEDFDFASARFDPADREDYGEERWNAVGFLGVRLYHLTFTILGEDHIRAISFRKASTEEEKLYEYI
jgi:uncharacterized DUF497 family protein